MDDNKLVNDLLPQLFNIMPDALLITNEQGQILAANSQVDKLCGYTWEELQNQPVEMLIPNRYVQQHKQHRRQFNENPIARPMERGVALYIRNKNGNEIPTHIMLTPLQTQEGPRVLVVIRDISDLNQAHTMLQEAYSTLEQQVEKRTVNLIQANDTLQSEIEARKQAEAHLEQVLHQIKTLSARLLDIQEDERRSLALELHDQIGQSLTAIKLNIQAAQRVPAASAIKPHLEENLMMVEETLKQVRNLSLDLRPSMLDDLGLTAALRWYVDRQAQQAGYKAEFHADMLQTRLDSAIETACFRVAQEAVTNVNRHAYPGMIRVWLQQKDSVLELIVQDDGDGFDIVHAQGQAVQGRSLGLLGMRERVELLNGRLDIESSPGNGTLVRAQFPLEPLEGETT